MDERWEARLAEFEAAWQAGTPPNLIEFINAESQDPSPLFRQWLVELVLVDLEYRWRAAAQGTAIDDVCRVRPQLDDYARRLPPLGSVSDLPLYVAAEEYRVRHVWGDSPAHGEYTSRCPQQAALLEKLLDRVDRELAADQSDHDPIRTPSHATGTPSDEQRLAAETPPRPEAIAWPDPRAPLPHSDFLLQEHLGTGGMGKVYRAVQKSLTRTVAVKALLKRRHNDRDAVERFLREGRILASLRHPNIVGVHGLGRFPGGGYFLAMEYVDGQDLARCLETGMLAIPRSVEITRTVADAIHYAHSRGILHCDLKPSNVLLERAGRVVVSDFGLAQLISADDPERVAAGTIAYMAPEQADAHWGNPGVATDVYGIGGILYHLLTHRPPHQDDRLSELFEFPRRLGSPVAPAVVNPKVPEPLSRICLRCLEWNPEDRYASASAVCDALNTIETC